MGRGMGNVWKEKNWFKKKKSFIKNNKQYQHFSNFENTIFTKLIKKL